MATQNSSSFPKPLLVSEGGTGAITAPDARTNLGLVIGTDVLAQQTIGIANNNLLEVDGTPNSGEICRFTADGIEGRTDAELQAQLGYFTSRTGVYRHTDVDAGAMVPRSTNGAEAVTRSGTNDEVDGFAFDSITEEGVQFKWAMPDEWDLSTIKVKFYWEPDTGATAADGVTWGISAKAISNDDALDGAFSASVDTDDTVIAVGDEHIVASNAITVSGTPALGDEIMFEITRVVGDANDDMTEDAILRKIVIQWKESTTEPSLW